MASPRSKYRSARCSFSPPPSPTARSGPSHCDVLGALRLRVHSVLVPENRSAPLTQDTVGSTLTGNARSESCSQPSSRLSVSVRLLLASPVSEKLAVPTTPL